MTVGIAPSVQPAETAVVALSAATRAALGVGTRAYLETGWQCAGNRFLSRCLGTSPAALGTSTRLDGCARFRATKHLHSSLSRKAFGRSRRRCSRAAEGEEVEGRAAPLIERKKRLFLGCRRTATA